MNNFKALTKTYDYHNLRNYKNSLDDSITPNSTFVRLKREREKSLESYFEALDEQN